MTDTKISLDKIFSLEKKPDLFKIHEDIETFVKQTHPNLFVKITDFDYKPFGDSIIDAYKNIVHLKMMHKIPNFKMNELIDTRLLIGKVFDNFAIEKEPNKIKQISENLNSLVENHCGKLAEINISNSL